MRAERVGGARGVSLAAAAFALLLVAAGGSGYLGARLGVPDLGAELALRPPIVVLDVASAARGADSAQVAERLARHREMARRLADGGVLVLDAQAVLAAPADLYVGGDNSQLPGERTQ